MNETPWFALRTKARHEKFAAEYLKGGGFEVLFPSYKSRRQWTDRVKVVELPLFDGYLFCKYDREENSRVLGTPGVAQAVGFGNGPVAVPAEQIEAVRRLMTSGLTASPCPYLREGDKVRIQSGAMKGVEGLLVKIKDQFRFVLSVDMLQRSIAVEVDAETVEALK
jgi:transcription antitermination factor NusG